MDNLDHSPYVKGYGREASIASSSRGYDCPWCKSKKPFTHVEFYRIVEPYDRKRRAWRITYPGSGPGMCIAIASHTLCGPDTGYAIPVADLVTREGLQKWQEHLRRGKTWYEFWMASYLEDIHFSERTTGPFIPGRLQKAIATITAKADSA